MAEVTVPNGCGYVCTRAELAGASAATTTHRISCDAGCGSFVQERTRAEAQQVAHAQGWTVGSIMDLCGQCSSRVLATLRSPGTAERPGSSGAPDRPTLTPEIYDRFAAYYAEHPSWGSLHVVLDDINLADDDVEFCIRYAESCGDAEGAALARILLSLTRTQRGRISKRIPYQPPVR